MGTYMVIILFLFVSNLEICFGQGTCPGNRDYGEDNVGSRNEGSDTLTVTSSILITDWNIGCCGIIERYRVNIDNVPNAGCYVDFQVWRQSTADPNTYTLVGENTVLFTDDGVENENIPKATQIPVKANDVIGWRSHSLTECLIRFDQGNNDDQNNYKLEIGDPPIGQSYVLSNAEQHPDKTYGLEIRADQKDPPDLTNLPGSTNINNDVGSGVSVFNVSAFGHNIYDELQLSMTPDPDNRFLFNPSTGHLTTGPNTEEHTTDVTLTFTATDLCGTTDTQTYTVRINNLAPTITSLPDSVSLREDEDTLVCLHNVSCSDAVTEDANLEISCGADCGPLIVQGKRICYSPGPALTDPFYRIPFTCSDGEKTSDPKYLWVDILPNYPPVCYQQASQVLANSTIGTFAHTVDVTNAEADDTLSFNMTGEDPECVNHFAIFDDREIRVEQTFQPFAGVLSCDFDVFVNDSWNVITCRITIAVIGFDTAFICVNLPTARPVQENTPLGTELIKVELSDPDEWQTKYFALGTSGIAATYFNIDSTNGSIFTDFMVLDYETLAPTTTFVLPVQITDQVMNATCNLTVIVIDEPEPPSFDLSVYYLYTQEGPALQSLGIPPFFVFDGDSNENHTFSLSCGSMDGYVAINRYSAEIFFATEYYVDGVSKLTTISCNFTVTDKYGLTNTSQLIIDVEDTNNHSPDFSQASYAFLVAHDFPIGDVVGQTPATDLDFGDMLTYSLSGPDEACFFIDQNGMIKVIKPLNDSVKYTFTVTVTDSTGKTDNASVTVVVLATTTASPTTTTYRYKTMWDKRFTYFWFIPCVIALLVAIGLLCWVVYTCRGEQGCSAVMARMCRKKTKLRFRPPENDGPSSSGNYRPTVSVRKCPPPRNHHSWM